MSNSTFDFKVFIKESKDVLVNPKSYFSTMKTTGEIAEPLIKAVIYGVVAGLIAFILSILNLNNMASSLMEGTSSIRTFFFYILTAITGLFLGAVFLLVISAICKGNTDFIANLRVTSSVLVFIPIMAILGISSDLSLTLYSILLLLLSLYTLYLLFFGLIKSLNAKAETVKIVLVVLLAIIVLLTIGTINKATKVDRMNRNFYELMN
jgi:hypothetical protein